MSGKTQRVVEMSENDARRLLSSPPNGNLVEALRAVIESFRHNRWLAVDEVAELAGTSVRSLQRELASNGVAFSQLVDEVRYKLAIELLNDKEVTLDAIASALGYSTTTNLARAFQRWTGVKLGVYRSNSADGPASSDSGKPKFRSR